MCKMYLNQVLFPKHLNLIVFSRIGFTSSVLSIDGLQIGETPHNLIAMMSRNLTTFHVQVVYFDIRAKAKNERCK